MQLSGECNLWSSGNARARTCANKRRLLCVRDATQPQRMPGVPRPPRGFCVRGAVGKLLFYEHSPSKFSFFPSRSRSLLYAARGGIPRRALRMNAFPILRRCLDRDAMQFSQRELRIKIDSPVSLGSSYFPSPWMYTCERLFRTWARCDNECEISGNVSDNWEINLYNLRENLREDEERLFSNGCSVLYRRIKTTFRSERSNFSREGNLLPRLASSSVFSRGEALLLHMLMKNVKTWKLIRDRSDFRLRSPKSSR